jgi:molecular chaperone DnaK (HSP70)
LNENARNSVLTEYAKNQSNPSKSTFNAAVSQIQDRLEKDVLPEFLKSPEYKTYEEKVNSKKKFGKK